MLLNKHFWVSVYCKVLCCACSWRQFSIAFFLTLAWMHLPEYYLGLTNPPRLFLPHQMQPVVVHSDSTFLQILMSALLPVRLFESASWTPNLSWDLYLLRLPHKSNLDASHRAFNKMYNLALKVSFPVFELPFHLIPPPLPGLSNIHLPNSEPWFRICIWIIYEFCPGCNL